MIDLNAITIVAVISINKLSIKSIIDIFITVNHGCEGFKYYH